MSGGTEIDARQSFNADERSNRAPLFFFIGALVALLLAYVASPYVTLWQFKNVLESNDRTRMETYVDFRSVRESLKQQLRAKIPRSEGTAEKKQDGFAGLVERLAPALIDQLVDAFVTPDGLAALIADPQIAKQARAKNPNAIVGALTADKRLDSSEVKHAFFTGPRDFMVNVQETKLRFRFSKFRWTLKTVELPLEAVEV